MAQVDADEWKVSGFGLASFLEGDYSFSVDATGVSDVIGNPGTGSLNTEWTVDRSTPITVTNLHIDPDRGYLDTDGITSGLAFNAVFTLSADAAQVTISQTSFGSEVVLYSGQSLIAGVHAIQITLPTGGNTGLKVTALASSGASALAHVAVRGPVRYPVLGRP